MHSRDPALGEKKEDQTLKNYKSSRILAWISAKRFLILYICFASFVAFILFLFLYWITHGPGEIVESKDKERWQNHPIKVKMGIVRVGLRIMPSANTENNLIIMDYIHNTKEENESGNVDKSYHLFSNTANYFPSLNFQPLYVPFGEPEPFCFHLSWTPADKVKLVDKYKEFEGLTKCILVGKGHRQWHKEDPKVGVDIKMWREDLFNIGNCGTQEDCTYACESKFKGVYKNDKCFSYSIVENICFKVHEETLSQRTSTTDDRWKLVSGCYEDGAYTKMVKAIPGFEYTFSNVPIEVRAEVDPFAGKLEEEQKESEDPGRRRTSFGFFKFLMILSLILFIIFAILTLLVWAIYFFYQMKVNEDARFLVRAHAAQ